MGNVGNRWESVGIAGKLGFCMAEGREAKNGSVDGDWDKQRTIASLNMSADVLLMFT